MPLDADAVEDSIRQELLDRWIAFLEIEHESLPDADFPDNTLRLVLDNAEHTVTFDAALGARTYSPAPFQPSLMSSDPDRSPDARITIASFDEAIRAVRLLQSAPEVRLFVALESDLALVPVPKQREATGLCIKPRYSSLSIELPVVPDEIDDEAQSRHQFTPTNTPGLFGVTP